MLNESVDLLEELDNVSRIHFLDRDDIDALMLEFGKRITAALKIERINVWLFNGSKEALISIGEYDTRTRVFAKDSVIEKKSFPGYFNAINSNKIVLVPDIRTHEATAELYESYSRPHEICSLMDIPLRIAGELVGVICFEKTGETKRVFSEKEQTFALSLSLVLASNLEARYRRAVQSKLDEALKEKELLIQEINHRVKNNFSILISLLRLSKNQGKTVSPAEIYEEYEQRIFSMLKVHELLYQTKNYTSISSSSYLDELAGEFRTSHPELAKGIVQDNKGVDVPLSSKKALHLGLIITEIFLNSVKHASQKDGFQFSIVQQTKGDSLSLKVGDNGKGFDFAKNSKNSSLGLSLITGLAEDVDIKMTYPTEGNGYYYLNG